MVGWSRNLQSIIRQVGRRLEKKLGSSINSAGTPINYPSPLGQSRSLFNTVYSPTSTLNPLHQYLQKMGISSSRNLLADVSSDAIPSPLTPVLAIESGKTESLGAVVSKPSTVQAILKNIKQAIDQITTVSERTEGVDPLVQRFKSLHIAKPILTCSSPSSTDGSLTDILVKKRPTPSSSSSGTLNPKILLELFSMYHDWQEAKVKQIAERQEGIENKIEVVDALAVKLLQRFNSSASAMRTTSRHLSEVQPLQVEVGELKGRLTEVISNCDALCKRIAAEGPESLRSTVKPFSASIAYIEPEQCSSSPTVLIRNSSTSTAT